MDLPIVCTLTEAELRERRRTILDSFRDDVAETVSLPNGYIFKFAPHSEILARLARLVALEQECCRFLSFRIVVEASENPVSLEVTGPPEAKSWIADFLRAL